MPERQVTLSMPVEGETPKEAIWEFISLVRGCGDAPIWVFDVDGVSIDADAGYVERPSEHDDNLLPADPRFPGRPHTLDFARLSSAVSEQDAIAELLGLEEALGIDAESLLYMAEARIAKALVIGAAAGSPPSVTLQSLYFDAFQMGVGFQKRGGHRPTETGTAGEGSSS
jgi:hypothetical protein